MKRRIKIVWWIAALMWLLTATSCVNYNRLIFDDDAWSAGAFDDDDRSLINGELEADDWDR
ncbi:MAG: hypothetical protein IJ808_07490 [Muribaculaceae bacterium]|nr:hypothetical protein [Muribaculaceae bacterium]